MGDQILLDVYVPTNQPNPSWLGAVQLNVTMPAAGLNNAYLGQAGLTGFAQGAWHTLTFSVPTNVRQALASDGIAAQFKLMTNTQTGAPPLLLDNLRFSGTLTQRIGVLDPCAQLDPTPIPQTTLFSFDVPKDWTTTATGAAQSVGTIGNRIALEVDAQGYTPVVSRTFATTELSGVSSTLLMDIMPPSSVASAAWQGAVSAQISCPSANIYGQYLSGVALTGLAAGRFQSVSFPLPSAVVSAFKGANNCTIEIDLNVTGTRAPYYLDNMRFGQ